MQIAENNNRKRTKIRNIYGITPIPIYVKEDACNYDCIYCPKIKDIPKSYLKNEDTLRAKAFNYSPSKQVEYWKSVILKQGALTGPIKLEIIILGGTFSNLNKEYRITFLKGIYDALNDFKSKTLTLAKSNNSLAKYRACIITIETRPDLISNDECEFLRVLGISKIELGVQSIYNNILDSVDRKYTQEVVINSTKLIKSYGFKIGYHIMLRLPYSTAKMDLWMLNEISNNSDYIPDYLKIYPLVYFKEKSLQKKLYKLYRDKPWDSYDAYEIIDRLIKFKSKIPEHIRIQRIGRQFEINDELKSIRQRILDKMKDNSIDCKCIRCRELKTFLNEYKIQYNYKNNVYNTKYSNNDYFIQVLSSEGNLLGYLKLYTSQKAIIREIKVVGRSSNVGHKSNLQGNGIGHMLIEEAEKLALKLKYNVVYVNASPGVYSFFLKMNYKIEEHLLKRIL